MSECESVFKRFLNYCKDHALLNSGDKILLALSGGADSVALLHFLIKCRSELRISILAVHINHNLRGEESDKDETFCKNLCQNLGVPIIIRKLDFDNLQNLENSARHQRFEIFNRLLKLYQFSKIATAHHKNDQTETLLMNMFRGTGMGGMSGIKPISANVIHPMLCLSKAEITDYLCQKQIPWREDLSNANTSFRRNLVRHEIIPIIEKKINPSLIDTMSRQAEIFRKNDEYLRSVCHTKEKRITIDSSPEAILLDIAKLQRLADTEQFYILRSVYAKFAKTEADFYYHTLEEILRLCHSEGSKHIVLAHDITITKRYNELCFAKSSEHSSEKPSILHIEEDRSLALHMDHRFTFKQLKVMPKESESQEGWHHELLDMDKVVLPLYIRSREDGDRFVPLGMKHSKKLKEFFIDEKVPKYERDRVPLIFDQEKLIWVVGYRLDDRVRCDDKSTRYLHITAENTAITRKRAANRK